MHTKTSVVRHIELGGLEYTLSACIGTNDYYVDVVAWAVTGEVYEEMEVEFDPPKRIYERKGATSSLDTTYDLGEAQRVFEGFIKWDGCSDLTIYPDEDGNNHFCGAQSARSLGLVISAAYDLAKELMGSNCDSSME